MSTPPKPDRYDRWSPRALDWLVTVIGVCMIVHESVAFTPSRDRMILGAFFLLSPKARIVVAKALAVLVKGSGE